MDFKALNAALDAWSKVLSKKNILLQPNDLIYYQLSSLGDRYTTPCVLLPESIDELSQCIKIAYQYKIKIFPISRGQNHGYHSSTPMANDTIVLDLRYLNKIIEFNSEFSYVIIEPGVTFYQLYQFLAKNGSEYIMSGFTGSPDASIMANALERGIGKGIYGNREKASLIKEFALPDGQLISLNEHYCSRDLTANFQYSTTGIDIGNLFYQSNLGIITKMIISLELIPEYLLHVSFSVNKKKQFFQLIDNLRLLNNKKIIEPVYALNNSLRILMSSELYMKSDWHHEASYTLWSDDNIGEEKPRLGNWSGSITIHCCAPEEIMFKERIIRDHLQTITDNISFTQIQKSDAQNLIKNSLNPTFEPTAFDLKFLSNLGYTNYDEQKIFYCKSTLVFNATMNPVSDGCGLIFFTAKLPFNSVHLEKALILLQNISMKHDMEMPVTLQIKTPCIVNIIIPIVFDLNDEYAKEKAHKYHSELFELFVQHGYLPSRANSISMKKIFNSKNPLNELIRKIKYAVDKKNILSQNKYRN
jgi:4-cresol dehydrogenase (hydroxylating)